MLIEVVVPGKSGTDLSLLVSQGVRGPLDRLSALFAAVAGGVTPAVVRVRTDDSTGVRASQQVSITYADLIAGDYLVLNDGFGRFLKFTCVTSGTPVAGDGTFLKQTNATTTGANLAAAINGHPYAFGFWTATNASGTLTITAVRPGSGGNAHYLQKHVGTSDAFTITGSFFTGGIDPGARLSFASTFSDHATANDTITIGSVVLTCKSSPANESEFAPGADATATATNLVAKINAHSKLKGLVLASNALGVMTLALQEGGRVGALISVSKSCSVLTLGASSFAPSTTDAWASSLVVLKGGAVSA